MKTIIYFIPILAVLLPFKVIGQNNSLPISDSKLSKVFLGYPTNFDLHEPKDLSKLVIETDNGEIKNYGEFFEYNAERTGVARVWVKSIDSLGDTSTVSEYKLTVRPVPMPKAELDIRNGGRIRKNVLRAQEHIYAKVRELDTENPVVVIQYSVLIIRNDSVIYKEKFLTNEITPALNKEFEKVKVNDNILIKEMKAQSKNTREIYDLDPIAYTIIEG